MFAVCCILGVQGTVHCIPTHSLSTHSSSRWQIALTTFLIVELCYSYKLHEKIVLQNANKEFLLWLSGLRTQHSVFEDAGWIHGLTLWVKDTVLPHSVAQVADGAAAVALILALTWELPQATVVAIKRKKKKKKPENTDINSLKTTCVSIGLYAARCNYERGQFSLDFSWSSGWTQINSSCLL